LAKVLLFSSEKCVPCKIVEEILKRRNIEYEKIDIETEKGMKLAKKYNIRAVPTIIYGDKKFVGLAVDRFR